ncbi:MAG: amidohydrolase family protein [Blastocatellia bacterium]|nr:amidohydrolase family protein [Blastocatellia bacterium]
MNADNARKACVLLCTLAFGLTSLTASQPALAGSLDVWAITGARIVPVSGPPIEKGTVVVRNGLIESVGAAVAAPADARIVDGTGLTVYPGLVDTFAIVEPDAKAEGPPQQQGPPRGPDRENPPGVTPQRDALDIVKNDSRMEGLRAAGFTTMLAVPKGGVFRGRSVLVNTSGSDASAMAIKSPAALPVAFETQGGFVQYPGSLMGVFSVIRQKLLDAMQYRQLRGQYAASPRGIPRPTYSREYEALIPVLDKSLPVAIEANRDREVLRALELMDEFALSGMVAGGRESWKVATDLKARNVPVLLSVNFPEAPADLDPETREELKTVRDRLDAPGCAAKLNAAGVRFAFQSGGIRSPKQVITNTAKAIKAGLSKDVALRALTLSPAEILGVADQVGSIEVGKIANLVVTNGDLFEEKTKVRYTFVDGERFEYKEEAPAAKPGDASSAAVDVTGTWDLEVNTPEGTQKASLELTQTGAELKGTFRTEMFGSSDVKSGSVAGKKVTVNVGLNVGGNSLDITFTGDVDGDAMKGTANVAGQGTVDFSGTRKPKGGAIQ